MTPLTLLVTFCGFGMLVLIYTPRSSLRRGNPSRSDLLLGKVVILFLLLTPSPISLRTLTPSRPRKRYNPRIAPSYCLLKTSLLDAVLRQNGHIAFLSSEAALGKCSSQPFPPRPHMTAAQTGRISCLNPSLTAMLSFFLPLVFGFALLYTDQRTKG